MDLEAKLIDLDKKITELELSNEALEREVSVFLSEQNVTEEQLSQFVSNSANFQPLNWEQLQLEKKRLDDKLDRELKNVLNPLKVKKSRQSLNIQPNWLFVR